MNNEIWIKWEPTIKLSEKFIISRLIDDKNGFRIVCYDEIKKYKIQIFFKDSVLSYRSSDEGKRIKTLNLLAEKYGKDFFSKWSIFIVKNSEYIKWFNEESYNIYSEYKIMHFVFIAINDIVEILSTYIPEIIIRP